MNSETATRVEHVPGAERLVTSEMVDKARTLPPEGTRAAVRGEAIRNAQPGATAGWTFVQQNGKRFVMNDVLGNGASWKELKQNAEKESQ